MTEQTEFRRRYEYVIVIVDGPWHRHKMESYLDEFWTFGPEIVSQGDRRDEWRVEAFEGFDESIEREGPSKWEVKPVDDAVGPPWMKEIGRRIVP